MTIADYMNPAKFPLTSQPDLTPTEQMMIDSFNLTQLEEAVAEETPLTPRQKAILKELTKKAKHRKRLLKFLKEPV